MVLLSIGVHQHQQDANGERDGKYSNIFEERELCVKWWLLVVGLERSKVWRCIHPRNMYLANPIPITFAQDTLQQPAWREDGIESIMGITSFFYTFCCFVRWDNLFSILATFSCFETVPLYQRKSVEINQM